MCGLGCPWEQELKNGIPIFPVSFPLLPLLQFFRMIFTKFLWEWTRGRCALNWQASMLDRCGFRVERNITARAIDHWLSVNSIEVLPAVVLATFRSVQYYRVKLTSAEGYHTGSWCCIPDIWALAYYDLNNGVGRTLRRDRPRGA